MQIKSSQIKLQTAYLTSFFFWISHNAIEPSAEPVARKCESDEKAQACAVLQSECRNITTVYSTKHLFIHHTLLYINSKLHNQAKNKLSSFHFQQFSSA